MLFEELNQATCSVSVLVLVRYMATLLAVRLGVSLRFSQMCPLDSFGRFIGWQVCEGVCL